MSVAGLARAFFHDLRNLISAVEHFIAMEVLVKALPVEMPDPAKQP